MRSHLAGLLIRLRISLGTGGASVTTMPRPARSDNVAAETAMLELVDLPLALWGREETPTLVVFDEVEFARGHPQRTMLLAYLLSDQILLGEQATPALAAAVVDEAIQRTEPAHQALWLQLSRPERGLLAAAADGWGATSRAVAVEHGIGRSTLDAAARRMVDQGHLQRPGRGSALTDPLLAEWLRRR